MVAGQLNDGSKVLTDVQKEQIIKQSKLVAGIVAAYTGHDVDVATTSADIAVRNNNLAMIDPVEFLEQTKIHGEAPTVTEFFSTLDTNIKFRESGNGQIYLCLSSVESNCVGKPISRQQAIDKLVADPIIRAGLTLVEYYPGRAAQKTVVHIVSPEAKLPSPTGEQAITNWRGSGPVHGVIAINQQSNTSVLKKYTGRSVEFIFDPKSNTFAFGSVSVFKNGSPHEQLVQSIGIKRNNNFTVGGIMSVKNGVVSTTENSGHYGQNWTPKVREQFKLFMASKGIKLDHEKWSK
ncbi:polymorphic toxin type 43 domain-containing protein [Acinetobacter beijerinckii]|uniref:Uncharacterized protein n=1 Tax=Acinetobacter beijerinckii CIP 110307 TaxID=1217648 RepID=N9F7B0_9GAMM|nr:polymorphic toxin type 43 domain-containing protein [Acinetobacter beijerinckii]ENW03210.1 hypothetical protein F933_03240 [Acinetobacter beijerinckii CIP 110307]